MKIYYKLLRHLKSGTLIRALVRKTKSLFMAINAPIGDEYYGEKAENYLNHRKDEIFWIKEEEVLVRSLSKLKDITNILDIPFGTGRFIDIYRKNNFRVSGVDSSEDMIDVARNKFGSKVDECDIRIELSVDLSYGDNEFDLLVCYRFLPWIISFKDLRISLKEFNRVLRPEGYALLEFCVNCSDIVTEITEIDNNSIIWDKFNEIQIREILLNHGFVTDDIIPIFNDEENPNVTLFVCRKIST